MKRYWNFIFIIVIILIISCNEDPEILIEPEFITSDVSTPNSNSVFLSAHIDEEKRESYSKIIQNHGFLISDSLNTDHYDYPITKTIDLGKYDPTIRFRKLVKDLKSNTKYYVKAFVKINNQNYYANEIDFTTRPGSWERKAKFPGHGLVNATGFSLNEKGYIIGTIANEYNYSQVWEYDPATNEWKQKQNAPFVAFHPTSFVLNNKAYVYCSDLWEYDPKIDSWINKSKSDPDFISKGCSNIYSFVIDGIAYILSDHGNIKWNPATNEWSIISGLSPKRDNASSFVLDNKAYIIGGQKHYKKDQNIIEYDFQNNTYRFLGPMLNADGYENHTKGMVSFVLNGRAYIGMGYGMYFTSAGAYIKTLNDFYEFDPFMNRWHPQTYLIYYDRKGDVQTAPRTGGVSLVIGNRAFMGLGEYRSYNKVNNSYDITLYKDFWEFIPD